MLATLTLLNLNIRGKTNAAAAVAPVAEAHFPAQEKEPFMTTALSVEEVKSRQQETWNSGDYGKIAWITVPAADALCEAAGLRPGSAVPDVAVTCHVGKSVLYFPVWKVTVGKTI